MPVDGRGISPHRLGPERPADAVHRITADVEQAATAQVGLQANIGGCQRCQRERAGMPMTIRKLRWGILGVSRINDRLLPGFARAVNADLRAIASRSPER